MVSPLKELPTSGVDGSHQATTAPCSQGWGQGAGLRIRWQLTAGCSSIKSISKVAGLTLRTLTLSPNQEWMFAKTVG